jgi:glucose/arabinose dehydrogenase
LLTSALARPTILATGTAVTRWDRLDERHSRSLDLAATTGLLRLDSDCTSAPGERCKRNDQLITKVPVFRSGATQKNVFHETMVADPVLHAMATGAARTWFSGTVASVAPSRAAFDRFRARASEAGRPPLLVHPPQTMLRDDGTDGVLDPAQAPIERLTPVEPIRVELHDYRPDRLRFSVTAPAPGWVLVTDRWARSWEAVVNGETTRLSAGNFIFRAVPVREGRNMVDLTYRPRLMPALVILSWGTLGIVLMLSVLRRDRWWPQAGRHSVCAGAVVLVLMGWPGGAQAQTTPPEWQADWSVAEGFALAVDTEGYHLPTAIAFVPDPGPGPDDPLYFVTELHGRVRVVTRSRRVHDFAEGFVRRNPVRELPDPKGETGLAGICLDPKHGYVFVTFAYRDDEGTLRNDIVRFATRPRTFAVRPTAQQSFTALFAPYRAAISHQIGGCQVRGDALFVTVGDGRQTEESRKPGSLLGKVLRMSLDGRPLAGGPFRSRPTAGAAEYVWATGFRNPFGLKIVGGRLFVADNGSRIDRFVEVRAGEDFLWNGSDMSLGARAEAVLYPAAGPAQMDFIPPGARGFPPSWHGWFVIAASAPDRTGVLALPYGFDQRRMRGTPQYIVRHEAGRMQIVAGVAVGPDGLYYASILPDARGRTAVYRIQYDPPRAHPYRVDERRNVRAVIGDGGCLGCHRLGGTGGTAGPPLDRAELTTSLQARLDSPEYRRQVALVDRLEEEPFVSYRDARRAVLAASGSARLRTWLVYKLREPRFDNPDAQMPDPKLTEGEALRMADYLLNPGDRRAAPSRSLLSRLLPSQAGRRHLAAAFGVGLIGGGLGALAAVYLRRRHAGAGRPVARGDAREPTSGE